MITILAVLLILAMIVCAHLFISRQKLRNERDTLEAKLAEANNQIIEYDKNLAVLHESQKKNEEHFKELKEQAHDTFKALAVDALKDSTEQFLKLATQRFNVESGKAGEQLEARQKAIEAMVKPIRETLEKYNESLGKVEEGRREAYGSLTKQIELMASGQQNLRDETANLISALRRPEVRGRWGEIQLKRVAELAGMKENYDYKTQVTVRGEDGDRLRPDMVVTLPRGRSIVVDAKTPMNAYLDSMEADDDEVRRQCLNRHVQQVEDKVKELAAKGYVEQFSSAVDFIVLFIPGEAFLQAAVQVKPDLIERAMEKKVVIATPSTLISLFWAVQMGWNEERLAENAKRISEAGIELHKRLCTALEHLKTLGDRLDKVVSAYDGFVGSIERQVLPSARKMEGLGAKSTKVLPTDDEMTKVNRKTRQLPASFGTIDVEMPKRLEGCDKVGDDDRMSNGAGADS